METMETMETTRSTETTPRRWALGAGLGIALALGLVKLALHLATTGRHGYGFFVDELYFLAASEHLAWGFLDFPPLLPALTAVVRATLGSSLLAIRLVPSLAGAALVVLTAWIAHRMGGGRWAQALAALAVLVAPIRLGIDSFHSMNALEPLFWTGCAAILVHLLDSRRPGDPRWWLAFGAVAGIGLLNKHSMAFYGLAVAAALAVTPEGRRQLRSRWIWMGGAVALLLVLPNLVWLVAHGFPHFEMLAAIEASGRDVAFSPLSFFGQQVLMHHPLALPLWLGGLAWLLAAPEFGRGGWGDGRRFRVLGLAFLAVMAEMLLLNGRPYYPAPAYPVLFAAGGAGLEAVLARWERPMVRRAVPAAYAVLLLVGGVVLAPLALPVLAPESYPRYTAWLGIEQPRIENHRLGPLPQMFADRFGWPEMAEEVARVYHALPPEERERAAVFGQNYGQAGAIDLYGPALGLPKALSGHQAYHDWGPPNDAIEVLIVLDDDRETLEQYFGDVELAGRVEHPYSMPYQHFDIWICRDPKVDLRQAWPALRRLG